MRIVGSHATAYLLIAFVGALGPAEKAAAQSSDGAFFAPVSNGVAGPAPGLSEADGASAPPSGEAEPAFEAPEEAPQADPPEVCADVDGDLLETENDVYLVAEASLRVPLEYKTNVDTLNETDAVDVQLTINAVLGEDVCEQIKYNASPEGRQEFQRRRLAGAVIWLMLELLG